MASKRRPRRPKPTEPTTPDDTPDADSLRRARDWLRQLLKRGERASGTVAPPPRRRRRP